MIRGAPIPNVVARLRDVGLRYGATAALTSVSVDIPAGCMTGLIGPDGVGKSSLLALIAGARAIQTGRIEVLGGDMGDAEHRRATGPRIAYMPQGLGRNLYPTLSVHENVAFFGRLFGYDAAERARRIAPLLESTGLAPFADRPAGKLSGGMKQKLGLCCALIHDPDLLILDEPTTGVDPLSRRRFWDLIGRIRDHRPDMSVIVATAYFEEAERFEWLVAMDDGRILGADAPSRLLARTGTSSLEDAFIALRPDAVRREHRKPTIPPLVVDVAAPPAIEARNLTIRFGDFTAVDHVSFCIQPGEIFGFLGSNGCGKTTTMKALTGLLPAHEGEAWLFGQPVDPHDLQTRRRVGYMSQGFSLYAELTVRQNLTLHARLFQVPIAEIPARVEAMLRRFDLQEIADILPVSLPLGQRQRLSLAVALIHQPDMLILDEPTSGVDPIARDAFWEILVTLARVDGVTIFISTHFMNEAARCDRVSFMHAGRVLMTGTPADLMARRNAATLEEAFINCLKEVSADTGETATPGTSAHRQHDCWFSARRMFSYSWREGLELRRDPVRATLALIGSVILMVIMGYGITLDVEALTFAVLDRDQTTTSRGYALNLSGSRYFVEQAPIVDHADMDRRMRTGELSLALEIPPGFARDLARGQPVQIGAWVDGAMPTRAETVLGYVRGMHTHWLVMHLAESPDVASSRFVVETRFRYNPDVRSLVAMVPAIIPLLLILIPSMLTALSVVREKELGSITNFYVTPVTRLEFLLGKQVPYIGLALLNFLLLAMLAVIWFGVPLKGSIPTLALATVLYVANATALGLLISTFMRSQIAAIFGTAVLTMLPATQFSGMIDPISSLKGFGALVGTVFPTTHYLTIVRGTFSKTLTLSDLHASFVSLALALPVLLGLSLMFMKKQEV